MADVGKKSIGQVGDLWTWNSMTSAVASTLNDKATSSVINVSNKVTNYDNGTIYFAVSNAGVFGQGAVNDHYTSYLTVSTVSMSAAALVWVSNGVASILQTKNP